MNVAAAAHQQDGVEQYGDWTVRDAFISLVIALLVTVVTLTVLGIALSQLDSRYTFSLDHAVHQTWAWASILALSVLWLGLGLVHQIRSRRGPTDREPAKLAGETTDKVPGVFAQNHRMAGPRLTGRVPLGRSWK